MKMTYICPLFLLGIQNLLASNHSCAARRLCSTSNAWHNSHTHSLRFERDSTLNEINHSTLQWTCFPNGNHLQTNLKCTTNLHFNPSRCTVMKFPLSTGFQCLKSSSLFSFYPSKLHLSLPTFLIDHVNLFFPLKAQFSFDSEVIRTHTNWYIRFIRWLVW